MPKKENKEVAEETKKAKKAKKEDKPAKKASKKKADDDLFESFDTGFNDVDIDDNEDSSVEKALEAIKKQFMKKAKSSGSISQEELMDVAAKQDISENDLETLISFFNENKIKVSKSNGGAYETTGYDTVYVDVSRWQDQSWGIG